MQSLFAAVAAVVLGFASTSTEAIGPDGRLVVPAVALLVLPDQPQRA